MLDAAHWTNRLTELARQTCVPGAVLGVWARGQEILAAAGLLNRATGVRVSTDSLFQVGSLADRTRYLFAGGRVTPRIG